MSHHGMSTRSMTTLPRLSTWPTFYWAVVGSAIGVAAVVNVYNYVLYRHRLSAARARNPTPAKPHSRLTLWNATIYAFAREASNFSIHIPVKNRILRFPTIGRTTLIMLNVVVLLVLCLYGLNMDSAVAREAVGFRCGVITMSQMPLIFLLSGKNNIIGYLSGISYERLNWLHRWCARCMFLTATLHMGYFISVWAPYGDVAYQLKNRAIVQKGLAAWCILAWIVFSSMTPIRDWCYEVFVIQHIISFALFLAFVYIHTPVSMHAYVWIPVALFAFDRVFRLLRLIYANLSLLHPSLRKPGQSKGFLTCQAELTPLPDETTRIVIRNPPISWSPGQHVFLSCQSVAPLQNHPFTIASLPEDGRMEFFVKAKKGGTRRFLRYAEKKTGGLDQSTRRTVTIEGPYGCLRPLRQFDSVVLLAGSSGATYTIPLLRDLLQAWNQNASGHLERNNGFFRAPEGAATRHIRFVWVVKSKSQLGWFSEQLSSVYADFRGLQERLRDIKLELTVYITRDATCTDEHQPLLSGTTTHNPDSAPQSSSEHSAALQYRGSAHSPDEHEKTKDEMSDSRDLPPSIDSYDATDTRDTSRPTSNTSSTPLSAVKQKPLVHPLIKVFSGRPMTRDIIRTSLEQARGESAVVVCGPSSLVAHVKQDVCVLSDERAVHKGTGAQGIYLHTEDYSY